MFIKCIVFLLLVISKCRSKIQINIQTASNKGDAVITYSGEDNKIITGMEIDLFNITDDNLKRGVRVELGKIPDDVFLKDPTPYRNLYQKYNWTQVQRNIRVKKVKIIDTVDRNVTLKKQNIINNTAGRIRKKIGLNDYVENTIYSSWSDDGLPNDRVFYKVNVTFGKDSFVYENKWRNNSLQIVTLPLGISDIGEVFIKSGQTVTVDLKAIQRILLLKIDYSARLIGQVIANYAKLYGKYHFWAPAVRDIMKAGKLKNEIITTEFLEIRCYVDPKIKIVDLNTLTPIHVILSGRPFHAIKPKNQ